MNETLAQKTPIPTTGLRLSDCACLDANLTVVVEGKRRRVAVILAEEEADLARVARGKR